MRNNTHIHLGRRVLFGPRIKYNLPTDTSFASDQLWECSLHSYSFVGGSSSMKPVDKWVKDPSRAAFSYINSFYLPGSDFSSGFAFSSFSGGVSGANGKYNQKPQDEDGDDSDNEEDDELSEDEFDEEEGLNEDGNGGELFEEAEEEDEDTELEEEDELEDDLEEDEGDLYLDEDEEDFDMDDVDDEDEDDDEGDF